MENLDWLDQLADQLQPTTAQPQADNLDWLDQFTAKEEPKNAVTNLTTANQLTTPEQEAQVFRDSRTTGLPIDVLRELPHEAQMRMFEETVARDKRLQEYYSRDMSTAAISANDFEPLSQLAKTVDSVKTTVRSITEGYEQGREDIGQLGFDLFDYHVMGDTSREAIIAERKALAKGREEFDGIDYALNLAAKTGGTMVQAMNTAAYRAGQGMVVGAAGGAAVGSTFLGAGAIPGAITGGTAGAVAGARIGLADATFRMEAGHAIDEFKQLTDENGEKIDQQLATIMGLAYGATASGIEQLGISALAKVFPVLGNIGKGAAKEAVKRAMLDKTFQTQIAAVATKYAQGVTVETIEEISQEAAQIFAGWAATKISEAKDDTYFDAQMFTAENLARLGQVAKETAIGVGTLGVSGVTVASTNAAIQTSKAQVFDQQQAQIHEALQATQTKQLSPEHAEAFLDILGLGEEVYIPADAAAELYQSGATFLDKVGVSQEMVSDSAVAGQDVAVKLSSLHANLDQTEFTAVREIMKASPGAMSLRDVQAVDLAKSVDHIRELYSKATENEATFKQELARTKEEITAAIALRPDIETQLIKSGSTVTEYVNTWGKTVEAFSRRMAYYGAELNDTLQKIKVRVANAPTAQVMAALNVDEVDLAEIAIKDIEQNVAASEKLVIDGNKKDATISANAVTGSWFLDLGFSAKEATAALRAFTKGKKLTANQQVILDSWREENKRIREEFEAVPFQMFQKEKSPRGSVEIAPNSFIVNLFERANTTTLLHETAHIFLEEFRAVAEMADANETAVKDFETIKKWLKFDGGQFTTEQHETFARGFETYLMEGKAPDVTLERAFERFKKWLTQIYREVKALRSPINDDVRRVFDRLLTTEQEIENAAAVNEIVTATDSVLDALKVKPADREYMKRLVEAGKRRAEAKLQQARDTRGKELRKAWREEAEEELKDDPVYQLRDRFRQKGGGLDIDDVAHTFGPDAVERLRNRVGLGAVKKDGALVAQVAAEYGFASPDAMIDALIESPSKSEKLTQMVDAKLAEHDEQFKAEDFLIEAEEIAEHVEAVGRYLAAAAGVQNRVDSRAFEKIAKDRMADMPVSQSTRTDRFIAAIKTALKKERTAIATGDFRTAYEANQQARLNLEFAKQSRAIRKIVEDLEKLATRVNKSKPVSWQPGYRVNAIRLATRFGLVKKPNYTADDFAAAPELASLLSGDADALDGIAGLDWSEWLLKSDFATGYKTLTVDQLEELSNLMKYLRHAGKPDKDRVMTFANMTKEEVLEQLLESLGKMKERKIFAKDSLIKRLVDKAESLIEHMSIGLYIWQRADNYSNVGKAGKGVIGPHEKLLHLNLSRASTKELTLQREIAKAIEPYRQQIMKTLTKNPKVVNRTIPTTPSMSHAHGTGWTMEEVFAIALNRGNSYNWNAVLTGHNLSEAQANELLKLLSREDWNAIQGIWDTINGYWSQLQEVHERMNGFRQKKVEAEPFVTPDGQQMNGGYYPIKFDALMDETTAARDELQMFKDTAGAALAPSVRAGAMKARTNTGGKPVKLSLSVLGEHIDFVIGYLSHAELVRDINKLVTDKEYAETFKAKMGIEAYRQLRPMLKGIARAQNKVLPAMASTFEKFRGATSVYILGSSLSAPLSQPLGIFNFIAQENSKIYMKGLLRTIANPEKARADMFEVSPYMQDRWKMINKQVNELVTEKSWREFRLFGKSRNDIRELFLILMPLFDTLTTTPMWWGKYLDSLATNDPETSARLADESISMMQSSVRPMDQSQIIRDKGVVTNIFTMFFSFANAYFNYQRSMMLGLKAGQVSIPQFMRSVVLTGILPPLLWNILMNGLWGTPPEDEEDWAEVGYDVLLYQLYGVPFVRDVASYTARRLQGKYTGNIWDTPYFQVLRLGENTINSLIQVSKDLDDDEKREKALWSIAELTAITLGKGIPIPRIYKRVEEGYRQFHEEDGTLFNIVHPDPEKK